MGYINEHDTGCRKYKRPLFFIVMLAWIFAGYGFTLAEAPDVRMTPFTVPNQTPQALALLPFSPASARLLPKGEGLLRSSVSYSSIFYRDSSPSTSVNLDMELLAVYLRYDLGVTSRLQAGVELPFICYHGGFLDGFIESFHKAFDLPNAGREQVDNDLVRYVISHKGREIINRDSAAKALGDLRFYGKFAIIQEKTKHPGLSFLAQISLPTGDDDKGVGAGGITCGFGLALDARYNKFLFNANGLFFLLEDADVFGTLKAENVAAGNLCVGYAVTPKLLLMGQVNGATPLFRDTGVQGFDRFLAQLIMGFTYSPHPRHALRFSFAEDLITDSSPDFSIQLAWELKF